MTVQKNDTVEIEITGITAEGSGVGRSEGMAVFVPGAAVGDKLLVKILKTAKTYAFGKIERILTPSPDRIPLGCPQYAQCGGCVFRHMSYEAELKAKEQRVRDAIQRIGGFVDVPVLPILGSQSPDRYRNKAQLPIGRGPDGKIRMGFFATHSHRVVRCEECLLQPQDFTDAMNAFLEWAEQSGDEPYDETTHKGRLRHLYLRCAEATGEIMVCVVVNGNGVHFENELIEILKKRVQGLKSVIINSNRDKTNVVLGRKNRTIWGTDFITDRLCGLNFKISPLSFYQVNRSQAERLYGIARSYAALKKEDTLLDLYCGTGTIGLTMAGDAKRVIGVEIVEQAVRDARENAELNGIENAEFLCGDASDAAARLKQSGEAPAVVVLDPPRKGCEPSLIETVCDMSPERVVYVSCDPATLSRDLKLFSARSYEPKEITPVDMFPRTTHVETCVLMSKVENQP